MKEIKLSLQRFRELLATRTTEQLESVLHAGYLIGEREDGDRVLYCLRCRQTTDTQIHVELRWCPTCQKACGS